MSAFATLIRKALEGAAADGLTRSEAADALGIKVWTLSYHAKRHGVKFADARRGPRPSGVVDMERLIDVLARHEAGESHVAIGADYAITRERVRQIVKKGGGAARQRERREQRSEALRAIAEVLMSERPMSLREAEQATGFDADLLRDGAAAAGLKFLKRDSETEAMLEQLAERVKAGESINSVGGGPASALTKLLAYYCREHGIKSRAPSRWTTSPKRADIIRAGREQGHSWRRIASDVAAEEGVRASSPNALVTWTHTHAPELFAIRPPRAPKPPRQSGRTYPAARAPKLQADPQYANCEVQVCGSVKETALVNRGKATASKIADALGTTRNVIIGHWNRARQRGETAA